MKKISFSGQRTAKIYDHRDHCDYKHEKVNLSRGRIQYSVWPMQGYRSHISLLQSPAHILVAVAVLIPEEY